MSDIVFDNVREIKLMPMHRLIVYSPFFSHTISFQNPESDSDYSLDPVTRTDMYGCDRVVYWKASITFVISQNDLETMVTALDDYIGKQMYVVLELKAVDGQQQARHAHIEISRAGVVWDVKKSELRPRLTLKVTGNCSRLSFDGTTKVIDQNSQL